MADDLLHRPAPDLLSDETLTAMERDGWTPGQVRDLIKRYREAVRELARRDDVDPQYARGHAFALVETELREFCIEEVQLGPAYDVRIAQRHRCGDLVHVDETSLLDAVERLRRSRHG